jgi:outer membrane protein assembly factor BamD (BamD/ComL family)
LKYDADVLSFDTLVVRYRDSLATKDTSTGRSEQKGVKAATTKKKSEGKKDSVIVPQIDSSGYKTAFSQKKNAQQLSDSMVRSSGRAKFELAGLFYLDLLLADSAAVYYNEVMDQYENSEFAHRAIFTLAELITTTGTKQYGTSESLYRKLVQKYPESPYAAEARKILNLPQIAEKKDPAIDEYVAAENLMEMGQPLEAVRSFQAVAMKNPVSPIAAKALYTAGWLYENILFQYDSAYAVYKRLVTNYHQTVYAQRIQAKLTETENEMVRVEQERKEKEAKQKEEIESKEKEKSSTEIKGSIENQPTRTDTIPRPKY